MATATGAQAPITMTICLPSLHLSILFSEKAAKECMASDQVAVEMDHVVCMYTGVCAWVHMHVHVHTCIYVCVYTHQKHRIQ